VPCYRCGTRQVDPEPGKPSSWHRGVVREHQVLVCPDCYPTVLADLTRCSRCDSVRLVKQLDQVECLDCRLTRETLTSDRGAESPVRAPDAADSDLAAEVASALARILGT
jgi:hypothetical protein